MNPATDETIDMATDLHDTPARQQPRREPDAAPAAPTAAPPRRRRAPLIVGGALLLAASAWGGTRYLHARSHVSTDNAQIDGHITPIASKVQAFVTQVRVDDNERVRAGDTLVILDDRDLALRLRQAEAELASAQAQVGARGQAGLVQAQLEASRATAFGATAAVLAAEAALRKAEADLVRYRDLAAKRIVSAQQLDAAQAARDAAAANLETVRRQAAASGSNVTAARASVRGADARLAAAQAAVENARVQVGYTVITAPVDGVVARRSVEPGELVQPGQALMSVVPVGDLWVTANLKETQLADVRVGNPVEFTVDAYPGTTFTGTVASLSPATGARFALLPPDNATGNFTKVVQRVPVRIAADRPDARHPLRPGMSVEVEIRVK